MPRPCISMKTIIGNWKMNVGVRESAALARASLLLLRGKKPVPNFVICPPFVALSEVRKVVARGAVHLGAQNMSWEEQGAMTGEISARMLTEVGVTHVLIGHSERRHLLYETNDMVHGKVVMALAHQLIPIVCVGETAEERKQGKTNSVITTQLTSALSGVRLKPKDQLFIAYEPVWAIGTGETPTVLEVIEVHKQIREILNLAFGNIDQNRLPILYGGSVNKENAYAFMRESEVDGVLVGSASVKINQLSEIVDAAIQVLEAQTF